MFPSRHSAVWCKENTSICNMKRWRIVVVVAVVDCSFEFLIWFELFFSLHTIYRSHMFSFSFHDCVYSSGSLSFCSFSIKMNHKIATCRHLWFWFISPSSFCTDFFSLSVLWIRIWFRFLIWNTKFWIILRAHQKKKKKNNDNDKKLEKNFSLVFFAILFQLIYLYFQINAQDHVFK